jgi:hypothetical protein
MYMLNETLIIQGIELHQQGLGPGNAVTCNFQGDLVLIPNAPST